MNIAIVNRQRTRKINLRLLKKITGDLLGHLAIEDTELGINLVAAPEMAALNETFLHHDGSTDVITFDYSDDGRAGNPVPAGGAHGVTRPTLHGEIFVCVDEAMVQAKKFRTNWQSEVVRYIVHGVLHLQGYDDSKPDRRRKMKREENRLLNGLSRRFSLAQLGRAVKLSG